MSEQINAVWKPLSMGDLQDRIKELNDLVDLLRAQMRDQNMRTRDRFAMAALTGIISATDGEGRFTQNGIDGATAEAYQFADAMMEQRAKEKLVLTRSLAESEG